jgi:hypothetical protein
MGLKNYLEKKRLLKQLAVARRESDKYVGNSSSEAQTRLSQIYDGEAKVLVTLASLTGDREYFREAAETWNFAAEAADKSITAKGRVANMYREYRADAEKSFETRGGGKGEGLVYMHGIRDVTPGKKNGLEATLSILGFIGGAFFLSSNITGNVIADYSTQTTSLVGVLFFVIAIIAGILWFSSRKEFKKKVVVKKKKK